MSTAAVFPAPETAAPETPPERHPAPESTLREPSAPKPAPWQATVLGLLAQGASVAAMRHVGYSSAAFYKTCTRHPEFRAAAARARNDYRAQVAEEFHDSEAYARMLVDSIQRDEHLPASLRLRAALAILNRKGDRWLPSPIPAPEDDVDTMDTMDTMDTANLMDLMGNTDTMGTTDTKGTMDTVDTANTADTVDSMDTMDTVDTMDNLEDRAYRHILSEIEAMDSAFHAALQSMHSPGSVDGAAIPVDTMDTMDIVDTTATVGTASENGHASNAPQSRVPVTTTPLVPGSVAA